MLEFIGQYMRIIAAATALMQPLDAPRRRFAFADQPLVHAL